MLRNIRVRRGTNEALSSFCQVFNPFLQGCIRVCQVVGLRGRIQNLLPHIYTRSSFCLPNNKTHFSFPLDHGLYHIFYHLSLLSEGVIYTFFTVVSFDRKGMSGAMYRINIIMHMLCERLKVQVLLGRQRTVRLINTVCRCGSVSLKILIS